MCCQMLTKSHWIWSHVSKSMIWSYANNLKKVDWTQIEHGGSKYFALLKRPGLGVAVTPYPFPFLDSNNVLEYILSFSTGKWRYLLWCLVSNFGWLTYFFACREISVLSLFLSKCYCTYLLFQIAGRFFHWKYEITVPLKRTDREIFLVHSLINIYRHA